MYLEQGNGAAFGFENVSQLGSRTLAQKLAAISSLRAADGVKVACT